MGGGCLKRSFFEEATVALKSMTRAMWAHYIGIDPESFTPQLPGSKVTKKDIYQCDPNELARGIKVEQEHTTSKLLALEVAIAHCKESSTYYRDLEKMESKEKGK